MISSIRPFKISLKWCSSSCHCSSGCWTVIAASVLAWRLANAWWMTSSFAPDEYYQAIEPAYLYATDQLLCRGNTLEQEVSNSGQSWASSTCGDGGSGGGPLRSLSALPWEWWPQHGLRPALPVLLLAQLHKLLLALEARGLVSAAAAGALHPRVARLAGAFAATLTDLCAPALARCVARSEHSPIVHSFDENGSQPNQQQCTWASSFTFHALAWSLLGHWAVFSGTRALSNAWEAALAAVALVLVFPSPKNGLKENAGRSSTSSSSSSNLSSKNSTSSSRGSSSTLNSDNVVAIFQASLGWGCAASAALLRPSGLPFWAVMFVARAYQVGVDTRSSPSEKTPSSLIWRCSIRRILMWVLVEVLPPALVVVLLWGWADGHWYGWTCTWTTASRTEASPAPKCWVWRPRVWAPLAWLKFNWHERTHAASLFGEHPWHWYATAGIWAVAGPPLVVAVIGAAISGAMKTPTSKAEVLPRPEPRRMSSRQSKHDDSACAVPATDIKSIVSNVNPDTNLAARLPPPRTAAFECGTASWGWWAAAAHLAAHSLVPHKEERFLHMLLPLANAYAARASYALVKYCMAVDQSRAATATTISPSTKPLPFMPSAIRQAGIAGIAGAGVSLGAGAYLLRVHQVRQSFSRTFTIACWSRVKD